MARGVLSPDPSSWDLERRDGRLFMDGQDLERLARVHGTPLHVASARTLRDRCAEFRRAFDPYPSPVAVRFSYKTNPVAGVLRVIHEQGLGAEVSSGYELWLALRLGVLPERIVFNGSNKAPADLRTAVESGVGLVVADSIGELEELEALAGRDGRTVSVALRVCPDLAPRGIGFSFRTGSRREQFGLDAGSGEVEAAIRRAVAAPHLRLRGPMAHIGSGLQRLASFQSEADRLVEIYATMLRAGAPADLIDLGGGLGARHSRPFSTLETLAYLGLGRLPAPCPASADLAARYARSVGGAVARGCRRRDVPLPILVLEPGRAIASDAQVLLLRVGAVRERPGLSRIVFADGGAMTVSLTFLSEHHALLLANRDAPIDGRRTSIFGRLPSPMDVVCRNARLPRLEPGDLLAVMDAGAYFTSTATNFGGPRPAVVLLDEGQARLVRRRETPQDLVRVELPLAEGEDAVAAEGAGVASWGDGRR